jgi:hypothetical protein
MWDDQSLRAVLNYAIEMVETRMEGKFSKECTGKIIERLRKLFMSLNFNTHRQSLAIILTEDQEKVVYLSYPVKPVLFLGKRISLLDMAANIQTEASFYLLVLKKDRAMIYERNSAILTKVYESLNNSNGDDSFKNAISAIRLLNAQSQKPVFITGNSGSIGQFNFASDYSTIYFSLLHSDDPDSEMVNSLTNEIVDDWNHWQSKFIAANIVLAQKTNSIVYNIEAVVQFLRKGGGGLLLIEKRIKGKILNPIQNSNNSLSGELIMLIEKFLINGNRVEIIPTGLLKDMGGIALLKKDRFRVGDLLPVQRTDEYSNNIHVY